MQYRLRVAAMQRSRMPGEIQRPEYRECPAPKKISPQKEQEDCDEEQTPSENRRRILSITASTKLIIYNDCLYK